MSSQKLLAVLLAAMTVASGILFLIPGVNAEESEPEDLGEAWTLSPTFHLNATNDVDNVRWDFGDGIVLDTRDAIADDPDVVSAYNTLLAAHGGDWQNPIHTFSKPGDYTITVTAFNENGSTTHQYIAHVMGDPVITFVDGNKTTKMSVPKTGAPDYTPNVAEKPEDPVRENYSFDGWFTDSDLKDEFDWSTPISEHITLYAKWTPVSSGLTHSVALISDGQIIDILSVNGGSVAIQPVDPSKEGYTFGGWYTDPGCTQAYDWNQPVTGDFTLYAKWTAISVTPEPEMHTVSFSGADIQTMQVEDGSVAIQPADPSKEGYTFGGWYTDPGCTQAYDWNQPVTGNLTLYAQWSPVSDGEGGGIGIISILLVIIGAAALIFGLRSYYPVIAVIGIIVLVIGCMSIYADYTAEGLVSWIKDLLGGGKNA